jgi:co-chaperonin GroES (HSP10)
MVVYRKYSGTKIEVDGDDQLVVVDADDILGVVEG